MTDTTPLPASLPISEQTVLVTGGGRGVGTHLVRAFAQQGARVIINYRSSHAAATALAAELEVEHGAGRVIALEADVTDREAVDRIVADATAHFGTEITTVVSNALPAFSFNGDDRPKAADIGWDDVAAQFEGTVRGALNTVQAVLPGMRARGFGRVITVGTNLFQHPVVPYHDYTAAKAALLSLTRTLAHDLGPDGITVNMISGGLLRTTDASAATPDAVFEYIAAASPLRRVTTPREFADAALFFASEWSRAVTGQNLVVDGGLVNN
ncbi:3-oxoacyl-[acyl-carrier protein] reductase [Leucobacter exalbidus]|uniref:3-oxoacyl-[acyl-carrier protein] reductase n=1 Tax=Leucobacter exalbidus TaxID=662960 RepID=A0A940T2V8_9MICO|nr:3-oxoacyl-ACP reductase [Leucobacter exalbidus]MBP1325019.1 3-oxoacyl-[acyl-carrier protein] reductase [Leucobacter exalbidus]